ncbi:MAG: carbon-nitrogen hydrolase family protein [Pseudomonadota bacterium]
MSKLAIAAVQLAAEKTDNLDLIERETRAVALRFPWLDMVVFPELAAYGVSTKFAQEPGGDFDSRMAKLAKETGLYLIPGSSFVKRADKVFNTASVFAPDGAIIAQHDKFYPFLPYEKGVENGSDYCVFEIPGIGKVGLAICYDMWFPEAMRTLAAMGAEVIVLPTLTNTVDRDVELAIARANAAVNQCFFVDVNCAGALGNGRSVFYGPGGELIYESGDSRDVAAFRLDLQQVRDARQDGWNGLGQVMKSFRDAPLSFPFHESPHARRDAMAHWGELNIPTSDRGENKDGSANSPNEPIQITDYADGAGQRQTRNKA